MYTLSTTFLLKIEYFTYFILCNIFKTIENKTQCDVYLTHPFEIIENNHSTILKLKNNIFSLYIQQKSPKHNKIILDTHIQYTHLHINIHTNKHEILNMLRLISYSMEYSRVSGKDFTGIT